MDIYPSNFESKIGFDKVREILQGRCLSTLGKEQVDECHFSSGREAVERQLDETIEFVIQDNFRNSFCNSNQGGIS